MPTPPSNSEGICQRCRSHPYQDSRLAAGELFCVDCWRTVREGIATIPPVYRRLRPITPIRGNAGPFVTITGAAGLGKSVAAAEFAEHAAKKHGLVLTWANVPALLLKIRSTFDGKGRGTEEQIIREHSKCPLLVLDDLAAERVTDYTVSTLYQILNTRGEYERLTVVTSNLNLDGIARLFDDRIASRLNRYGVVVELTKNNVAPVEAHQ